MPKSPKNNQLWLTNLKGHITLDGPTCGQSPAQVTSDMALVDSVLTPVSDALTKQNAWLQADGLARDTMRSQNEPLRAMINRYKKATGWTSGMADSWDVATHETTYDMSTQKPTITADAHPSMVIIGGMKPGFDSVDLMMRIAGTATWTKIGSKISHLPFFDTTAPQTPGKPEEREYQALGYVGDNQVGQASDIVTATYTS